MFARLGSPDRRRIARGTAPHHPPRSALVATILGGYREMPGLSLYTKQAARLFGVLEETCHVVLADLVRQGHLRRSNDGQYLLHQ